MRQKRRRQTTANLAKQFVLNALGPRSTTRSSHRVRGNHDEKTCHSALWPAIPPAVTALIVLALASAVDDEMALLQRVLNEMAPETVSQFQDAEINLRQTSGGLSMTIGRVYADAQDIIIGYALSGSRPDIDEFLMQKPLLTDGEGREIQRKSGPSGIRFENGAGAEIEWFDGVDAEDRKDVTLYLRRGPFAFDIPVTVGHARIVSPNQVAVADDWTITLERVAVSPLGVRIALRGSGMDADVQLIAGGRTYTLYQPGGILTREIKQCWIERRRCPDLWKDRKVEYEALAVVPAGDDGRGIQVDRDETARWLKELESASGEWTIVIRPDPSRPNPMFELEGGPWTFHFSMP